VNHHDEAYQWAERRRLETHPKTGAAQLVEIRERVQEIPKYVEVERPAPPKPPVLKYISDGQFLAYGVPPEWLADVREATEDTLLEIAGHLPAEAAEALLNLATGIRPPLPEAVPVGANPFASLFRKTSMVRQRVSGSAGTGKTIVALHRAVHLARSNPEARLLLTTFSDILANALVLQL
jgi:hypothetical protein